ncbi:MAG: glycosyltransferase family 39 protein [Bacteroidia bacterium]|nr:glycosyltransferase family 39 protein [Bacteroidia bacterium]
MNILMPHINNMQRGTGIAAAEFPLIPFLAACCYKVFGFHNFWFRTITCLFFLIGFIYSRKLALLLTQNEWVSSFISLIWLCSPTLLYYIPNFNPDPAALGLIMMAWYYFFLLANTPSAKITLLFAISCLLALLLKASTAISIVAMVCLIILDYAGWLGENKNRILPRKIVLLLCLAVVGGIAFLWYGYVKALNAKYFSGFFTLETRIPQDYTQIVTIWNNLKSKLFTHYYSTATIWLIPVFHLITLILYKKIPRSLFALTWILAFGTLSFIYLMFVAFEYHDYYIIALLPWIFFLLTSACIGLYRTFHSITYRIILAAFFTWWFCQSLFYCYIKNSELYSYKNSDLYDPAFTGFYDAEQAMRKAGIHRNDYIVSITDPTYDVSLYLMNQKGYTVADKKDINKIFSLLLLWNARYVVTNADNCLPDLPVVTKFLGSPVLVHKNLKFYKPRMGDTSMVNQIYQTIHQHISEQIQFLDNDVPAKRYNQRFCEATGVSYNAVLHDAGLYLYKTTEQSFETALKAFALQHYGTNSITDEIKTAFANENHLDESSRYILMHPYNSWFNELK